MTTYVNNQPGASKATRVHQAVNRVLATVALILGIVIMAFLVTKAIQLQNALSSIGDESSVTVPADDWAPEPCDYEGGPACQEGTN